MIDDIGADEYNIETNEKIYVLRIGSTNNKINLNLSTRDQHQFKNYSGEFTLEDLRRINRVFILTQSIYEAKEEFKKAVERKKIAISERDDYVHTVFYMMIGTDTSTLSIALPRDETPRIIRLEQNFNILKLGRDNLIDRLNIFEKEAEEIKQDLDQLQTGNGALQQISETIGQGMPDVTEILRNYRASKQVPNYTGLKIQPKKQNQDLGYSSKNMNLQTYNNSNDDEQYTSSQFDQPYSSFNIPQPDLTNENNETYTSTRMKMKKKDDPGYSSKKINGTQFEPIKESMNDHNNETSGPVEENNMDENEGKNNNKEGMLDETEQGDKFKNGILKGIIKEEEEIEFVLNKIETKFPGSHYKLIYKGTRDGDEATTFHKKCDEAEKTLVIVEDNYGNRFGGFTSCDWGGQYQQKPDENAFIFSVDKNKTYDVLPGQNAIGAYPNFGPVFFGCQIRIYDNFFSKGGSTFRKGLNYNTTEDYELTGGNQNFGVRELEIYEVDSDI